MNIAYSHAVQHNMLACECIFCLPFILVHLSIVDPTGLTAKFDHKNVTLACRGQGKIIIGGRNPVIQEKHVTCKRKWYLIREHVNWKRTSGE